jgi:hypothetical protein
MSLLQNILEQRQEMHAMGQRPSVLRIDHASLMSLADEVDPIMVLCDGRMLGLDIEISSTPDFTVGL